MQLYDIALFVHILGIIALFGGFAIYHRAGARLRASTTTDQALAWLGMLDTTGGMFPGGLILLLASGAYMMFARWRAMYPWIIVGFLGLVLIWILGVSMIDRHRKRLHRELEGSQGPLTAVQIGLINDPKPWTVLALLNAAALGIVFIMSTKPQWLVSTIVVGATAAVGAAIGARVARRKVLVRR